MNRDIQKYEDEYPQLSFEETMVHYRKKVVLDFLKTGPSGRILEIGCGLDPLYQHYDLFSEMTIIEPSLKFFKQARTIDERVSVLNTTLIGATKSLKNVDFDKIVMSSILHELEDIDENVKCLKELMTKNSLIHINVPNANSLHRILALEMGLLKSKDSITERQQILEQYHVFSLESLSNLFLKHGFKIIKQGSYFIKPFSHEQMNFIDQHELFPDNIMEGFDKLIKYLPEYGAEIYINVSL